MTGTESVKAPAEVGSRRPVLLTVREKGICKACGGAVLRVSDAQTDTWVHEIRRRAQGHAVDHQARPGTK